ncbi:hypothetical protein TNCV_1102521 [Trichonephila clavipes]|nr:hypothetical protein TNCV_1102521 [Trichonephila clavipes]
MQAVGDEPPHSNYSQVTRPAHELASDSPNFYITPIQLRQIQHLSAPLHDKSLVAPKLELMTRWKRRVDMTWKLGEQYIYSNKSIALN